MAISKTAEVFSGMCTSLVSWSLLVTLPLVWTAGMIFHPWNEDQGEGSSPAQGKESTCPCRKENKMGSQPHSRMSKTTWEFRARFLKSVWWAIGASTRPAFKQGVSNSYHPLLHSSCLRWEHFLCREWIILFKSLPTDKTKGKQRVGAAEPAVLWLRVYWNLVLDLTGVGIGVGCPRFCLGEWCSLELCSAQLVQLYIAAPRHLKGLSLAELEGNDPLFVIDRYSLFAAVEVLIKNKCICEWGRM